MRKERRELGGVRILCDATCGTPLLDALSMVERSLRSSDLYM